MFWKQRARPADPANLDATNIVSQVGEIYAGLNERDQLVKPRSSLPCPWFAVRECFHRAYETEYIGLNEEIKNSYHFVYRELAFFAEDELCEAFNAALGVAAKCRAERMRGMGIAEDETFCRKFIAGAQVKVQDRKEIWAQLSKEVTSPRKELLIMAETLIYCASTYRAMWDEWAAYSNLISSRHKKTE